MPGSSDADEFWRRLCAGDDCISDFSVDQLLEEGWPASLVHARHYVPSRGALHGIDLFDADFFGVTPYEAAITDPQHRLFLECAWHALEDAGYDSERYDGRIGVFGSSSMNTYVGNVVSNAAVADQLTGLQLLVASDKDHLCTRVSYKLNLRGPSLTLQTACSSSLVAVTLACDSLLTRQSDMALAGGVSAVERQVGGYLYQDGGIVSPDGRCRAFDHRSKGTVAGSGVGIVVLKRLSRALADGDHVRALLIGWAINNDGSGKVGYTAPSLRGQAEAIAEAQAMANVSADTISYIEAHGTATPIGDPIEIAALTEAFHATTGRRGYCAIGSVKTNIGHLDAAAGIAGLIKTTLSLQHRRLPPSLHFEAPNPTLHLDETPFVVNATLRDWPSTALPRRAGVSSFGLGGTNAHVVMEEAPASVAGDEPLRPRILCLSAKTPGALARASALLAARLESAPDPSLADTAYTLAVGRRPFPHRRAVVCGTAAEAGRLLRSSTAGVASPGPIGSRPPRIAFAFPGQGSQHVHMAAALYRGAPTMRRHLDSCADGLIPHLGVDLRPLLYPEDGVVAAAASVLDETWLTQPAIFSVSYALACQLLAWGIEPCVLVGHSVGELVAAVIAGVFSLDDALRLIAARGRLVQEQPPGAMAVASASADTLRPLLGARVAIAVNNGPRECVIAGDVPAMDACERLLRARGIATMRLKTSHAFHSPAMAAAADQLERTLVGVPMATPAIKMVSTLTGTWAGPDDFCTRAYWAEQLRQPVQLAPALAAVLDDVDIVVEVGPGTSLTRLGRRAGAAGAKMIPTLPIVRDEEAAARAMSEALARLWCAGAALDWSAVFAGESRKRVPLPTYPFERQRHWVAAVASTPRGTESPGSVAAVPWAHVPSWKQSRWRAGRRDGQESWLIFGGRRDAARELAVHARRDGRRVVTAGWSPRFECRGVDDYRLDGSDDRQVTQLLQEIDNGVGAWLVVQAAGLGADPVGAPAALDEATEAFWNLVSVARVAPARSPFARARIAILTDGIYQVRGDDRLRPEWALLTGPARVIPQEYPQLRTRSLDLTIPEEPGARQSVWHATIAELASDADVPLVALRHGMRFEPVFEPMVALSDDDKTLPMAGSYVITGGCGGLGLAFAEYLLRHRQAKVALVTRRALPPQADWAALAGGGDEPADITRVVARLARLAAMGAGVLTVSAAVEDAAALDAAFERIRAAHGPIDVIVHAAGIAGGSLLTRLDRATVERTWAAKIHGTLAVARQAEVSGATLVLFSSDRALLGGVGRCDYVAANAFMDAFAQARDREARGRVVAINWGTWSEVGMAVTDDRVARLRSAAPSSGPRHGVSTEEGTALLSRALSLRCPQVVLSPDLTQALTTASAGAQRRDEPDARRPSEAQEGPAAAALVQEIRSDQAARLQLLRKIWSEALGRPDIGPDENFFEIGGDSVSSLQIAMRANDFGLPLTAADLFTRPTIRQLAESVAPADALAAAPSLFAAPDNARFPQPGSTADFPDVKLTERSLRAVRKKVLGDAHD